ncbi:bZIP transcription factor 12-like [Macadamia integrifolia]|uniref:bZIP transcription factor 12-like n=1 Tax=Macadamia integrifolia TaxID=60698 RepID=UPI001C4EA34B|nr:bZIP transcription factor 12-like [Macadamia integrifolia]
MLSNRFQQQQQQQQQRQQQQAQQQPQQPQIDGSIVAFGNGVEGTGVIRGKRRVVDEPVDKVAQQRQRRMIKNRESAARSRERKQAYTVELESLVSQLEEENARLLKEQEDEKKKRLKQLMENVIPVLEKRRPRALRRARSV